MRTLRKLNSDTEGKIRTAPTFRYWPVSDGRAVCPLWVHSRQFGKVRATSGYPPENRHSSWGGAFLKSATSGPRCGLTRESALRWPTEQARWAASRHKMTL